MDRYVHISEPREVRTHLYTGALTSDMAKEPITTRLDADTKTEVENYADEHEIGQTEATRRLIRAGLASEGHPVATTDGGQDGPLERLAAPRTVLIGTVLFGLAVLPILGAQQAATAGAINVALGLVVVTNILMMLGITVIAVAALAQLALARPLRALVTGTAREKSV